MKKLTNYAVSLFVIVIVLLLIIPLSPFLLDVFIVINISISLIILLVSMNIREPAGIFHIPFPAADNDLVPAGHQCFFHKKYSDEPG